MNFISPEILMQNAIKNKYYRKPDDIYPPTEKDFDNSIHKFISDKNNVNNQRLNEIQDEGRIRYQDPEKMNELETSVNTGHGTPKTPKLVNTNTMQTIKRPAETFYIPSSKFQESFTLPTNVNLNNLNPQVLIIIIIIMLMIIIYLYCKVESLQTLNKVYEQNLIINKSKSNSNT